MEEEKRKQLNKEMANYAGKAVAVAFSGGADSSLLLKLACEVSVRSGQEVYAIYVNTKLHPAGELERAKKQAEQVGAHFLALTADELLEAGIVKNPPDRCYRCKRFLFERIKEAARSVGAKKVLDGTNADDLQTYRPGLKALKELGIVSPLAAAGLTKKEVRELAGEYGLLTANRPAQPCLATRFPYGTILTWGRLEMVGKAEAFLKTMGFYNLRLRVHEDVARIEVDAGDFVRVLDYREEIVGYLKALGYTYVALDLEGFRSGSMDVHLISDSARESSG